MIEKIEKEDIERELERRGKIMKEEVSRLMEGEGLTEEEATIKVLKQHLAK